MTREQMIAQYIKNLGLTRQEAEQLIADDEAGVSESLTPEQKKAVKEMTQADRKKEVKPRERKPDENKRHLINELVESLVDMWCENVAVVNPEREIKFTYNGELYRLTLAKPRKESK